MWLFLDKISITIQMILPQLMIVKKCIIKWVYSTVWCCHLLNHMKGRQSIILLHTSIKVKHFDLKSSSNCVWHKTIPCLRVWLSNIGSRYSFTFIIYDLIWSRRKIILNETAAIFNGSLLSIECSCMRGCQGCLDVVGLGVPPASVIQALSFA